MRKNAGFDTLIQEFRRIHLVVNCSKKVKCQEEAPRTKDEEMKEEEKWERQDEEGTLDRPPPLCFLPPLPCLALQMGGCEGRRRRTRESKGERGGGEGGGWLGPRGASELLS